VTYRRNEVLLPSTAPGVEHRLSVHQFSVERGGPSVYLQAGLHGNEHPGLLVLQHILAALAELDRAGAVIGHVTVVPYANPTGMSQRVFGSVVGRFDLDNGENFNRNFPQLSTFVTEKLAGDERRPITRQDWKDCFKEALGQSCRTTPIAGMKAKLAALAISSDVVLDLHCGTECVSHAYASALQATRARQLAEVMGAPFVMVEPREAGGGAF
jgi:predicted deacylase